MFATVILFSLVTVPPQSYAYVPASKKFRIELPSQPFDASTKTIKTANGLAQLTVAQTKTLNGSYLIQVTEHDSQIDPDTLNEGIRQFIASKNGTLESVNDVTVDGQPGREFVMTERSPEGQRRSRMRWIVSGNSLFMLSVVGNAGFQLPADATPFFNSLEIGNPKVVDRRLSPPPQPEADQPMLVAGPLDNSKKADDSELQLFEPDKDDKDDKDENTTTVDPKPDTTPKYTRPAGKVAFSKIPRDAKSYGIDEVQYLGRPFQGERDGFLDAAPSGSVLVGFVVGYVDKFGGPKIGSVQPIFRSRTGGAHYRGKLHGPATSPLRMIVARPGYAVGGLVTHSGLMVDGFSITFMKVDGDRLKPDDSYESPWIGDSRGGGLSQVFSKGELVIGLTGRAGNEVNGLGLMTKK